MLKRNNVQALCALSFLAIFAFSGCDQIAAIKEYFSKSDSKKTASVKSSDDQVSTESKTVSASDFLARVGSWTITPEEFSAKLAAMNFDEQIKMAKEKYPQANIDAAALRKQRLQDMVDEQVVYQDAEQQGITKQKDLLDAVDEYRRNLVVSEAVRKVTDGISVTDQDVKNFYEENKNQIVDEPVSLRVREIVVGSEDDAKSIFNELAQPGADFAEIAKKSSKSKTAANGGDLGFINEVPFPEMADILKLLQPGQSSQYFKGPEGFYIVKLEEKKGGKILGIDDKIKNPNTGEDVSVKDLLKANLEIEKRQSAILSHVKELREKMKAEVNESLLP